MTLISPLSHTNYTITLVHDHDITFLLSESFVTLSANEEYEVSITPQLNHKVMSASLQLRLVCIAMLYCYYGIG